MPPAFTVIIPARYGSTRLPGKPLLDIKGKPLIRHAYETAKNSQARAIYVATDDARIATVVEGFGGEAVLTSGAHQSGADRLAEASAKIGLADDEIIVNLQGDEFGLPPILVNQVAEDLFRRPDRQMATLCERIERDADYHDPNVVKVVFDAEHTALYFSRAPIPATRRGKRPRHCHRHIGLYAYRAAYLQSFTRQSPCQLEQDEALEQLRVLYNGGRIHIAEARARTGIGIDSPADLALARGGL